MNSRESERVQIQVHRSDGRVEVGSAIRDVCDDGSIPAVIWRDYRTESGAVVALGNGDSIVHPG